eukprot:6188255-Pleurochrysis_carterae.AAC.1
MTPEWEAEFRQCAICEVLQARLQTARPLYTLCLLHCNPANVIATRVDPELLISKKDFKWLHHASFLASGCATQGLGSLANGDDVCSIGMDHGAGRTYSGHAGSTSQVAFPEFDSQTYLIQPLEGRASSDTVVKTVPFRTTHA